jgi:hypothetical protein
MTKITELKNANKLPDKRTPFSVLSDEQRQEILIRMERDLVYWQKKREQRRNENS